MLSYGRLKLEFPLIWCAAYYQKMLGYKANNKGMPWDKETRYMNYSNSCSTILQVLDTLNTRSYTEVEKGMCEMQAAKIKALLTNYGISTFEAENVTSSVHQVSCWFNRPIRYISRSRKAIWETIPIPFIYLASWAVHLQMADGLDTDAMRNAFYKMASKRVLPEFIYQTTTNFKGGDE